MRRRPFNIASAVSLLLCVAMIALWIRSYWRADEITRRCADYPYSTDDIGETQPVYKNIVVERTVRLDRGSFQFRVRRSCDGQYIVGPSWEFPVGIHYSFESEELFGPGREPTHFGHSFLWNPRAMVDRFGFFIGKGSTSDFGRTRFDVNEIAMPSWILVFITSVLPAWSLSRFVRIRLKRPANLCQFCGYNLTGNTSGTCPECGTPITLLCSSSSEGMVIP